MPTWDHRQAGEPAFGSLCLQDNRYALAAKHQGARTVHLMIVTYAEALPMVTERTPIRNSRFAGFYLRFLRDEFSYDSDRPPALPLDLCLRSNAKGEQHYEQR